MRPFILGRRRRALAGLVAGLVLLPAVGGSALAGGQATAADVRLVTERYHDLSAALADGYVPFYVCTEEPGIGTMGQHFVNPSLVGDPAVDPLHPEVLVYVPTRSGSYRLVAVEYVTLASAWHDAFGSTTPAVLGQTMEFTAAGNRYGLPDFYELHAWIWQGNPLGLYSDWNPDVSCLGTGDNGG